MEQLMEKTQLSRRKFLQVAGALSATATLYGCSGGGDGSQGVVTAQDNLVLDKSMQVVMASHPFNCGGRCELKIHVKNGRMVKVTGLGDTPRAEGDAKAEDTTVYQTRGCLRGYAQIKRTYAPDRLKYPLKQTKARGDLNGFVRISWDEALGTVASWVKEMQARQTALGLKYLPILDCGVCTYRSSQYTWKTGTDVLQYLGPTINLTGAPSSENINFAKYGTTGTGAGGNSLVDMMNTKFLLIWAQDPCIKAYNNAFMLTKAKEAGIPIVTVSTTLTDTALLSTGYSKYNLPGWIQPRPATDSAMLAAMAYVIYKKNLHDDAFIKQQCFGFYPGDTVVSQSTFTNPLTKKSYSGTTFTVPPGMSYVEYLNGLETKYGSYAGVLKWASDLSGVPTDIIENLGIAFGTTKPAMMWAGNAGGQKTNNGMQHCMSTICLAAMTGNTNKSGGGPGFDLGGGPGAVSVGQPAFPVTTAVASPQIKVGGNRIYDMIKYGRDQRTAAQLQADVLKSHSIDLGANASLHVEMLYGAPGIGGNSVNASPCTTKNVLALKLPSLKYYVIHEQFMTPTAALADIILPCATHHERPGYFGGYYNYCHNTVIAPMYECKTDLEIDTLLAQRLGVDYGLKNGRSEFDEMREKWNKATVNATYKALYPDATLPTFDDFAAKGVAEFPLSPDKAIVGTQSIAAGKYPTDTGRINFFSPYYFYRDQDLGISYKRPDGGYYRTAQLPMPVYARPYEGYQDILEGKVGAKGIKYTLQFTTNHPRNRAHTVYDNVSMLKDEFPTVVKMHPVDAATRGISNGDLVYVFNDWGCLKIPALVTNRWKPGIVDVQDGSWYRASTSETYEAWLDTNMDGIPEKQVVPVDVGGCPNSITHDFDDGPIDPFLPAVSNNHFNGNLVEVSKTHPDKK